MKKYLQKCLHKVSLKYYIYLVLVSLRYFRDYLVLYLQDTFALLAGSERQYKLK